MKKRALRHARDAVLVLGVSFAAWQGFERLPSQATPTPPVDPVAHDPDCRRFDASMDVWVPGGPDYVQMLENLGAYVCG